MDDFPPEMICLFVQPNTDLMKANGVVGLQLNPVLGHLSTDSSGWV